jgi:CRISPR-associated protein Csm5
MSTLPITISTLSPVHIGCDEVYEPSNFVIHDGLLHALDVADLAQELTDAECRQLATLSDGREPIGALQRFFRDRAERFSALARHQVEVAPDIVVNYEQNAGKPAQRGSNGEAVYNVFPISRTSYRPLDNTPYLPGSSLKGSIRTAWLNKCNHGADLSDAEKRDRKSASRLQERLLGYTAGKFENDPFRHLGLADAHPEDDTVAPPTRILYAISKKKRLPRDGERAPQELKVFLETLPDSLPAAFHSEIRLSGSIDWKSLCDACNGFYLPQLEAELAHDVLGQLIDPDWKRLIGGLLGDELGELVAARQGFLLRVGRHSGAESVTLQGLRNIKILGPRVDGKQTFDFRPLTTEKRFASLTKAGTSGLLPFGWIWVDACDDAHRHLSDNVRQKLATRSEPLRQAHQDRLQNLEAKQLERTATVRQAEAQRQAILSAARAAAAAAEELQSKLATMTSNMRRIEEFKTACANRAEQLGANRERQNADFHSRARKLAQDALDGTDWTADEKRGAADAIAEWLPKVVEKIDKDALKKLKLSALRG